jgi:hypothetical protein
LKRLTDCKDGKAVEYHSKAVEFKEGISPFWKDFQNKSGEILGYTPTTAIH